MSKFLITGGAGFIGSSIAEYLVNQGHFVRVLDNFYSGKEENLDFAKGLGKGIRDFKTSMNGTDTPEEAAKTQVAKPEVQTTPKQNPPQ